MVDLRKYFMGCSLSTSTNDTIYATDQYVKKKKNEFLLLVFFCSPRQDSNENYYVLFHHANGDQVDSWTMN